MSGILTAEQVASYRDYWGMHPLLDSHEALRSELELARQDAIRLNTLIVESSALKDARIEVENGRLKAERDEAKRQVVNHQANNRERNLELDALHYVWCDGGCAGGIHRFGEHPPLTQEIVELAVRNTSRIVHWFLNKSHRDNGHKTPEFAERYTHYAGISKLQDAEDRIAKLEKERDALDKHLNNALDDNIKAIEFQEQHKKERDAAWTDAKVLAQALESANQLARKFCAGEGTACDERDAAIDRIELWNGRYIAAIAERDGLRGILSPDWIRDHSYLPKLRDDPHPYCGCCGEGYWCSGAVDAVAVSREALIEEIARALPAVPAPAKEKTCEGENGENSNHIVRSNGKVGPHVGSHSTRNVWDGDRQIAYASDEGQAARIVAALISLKKLEDLR